MSSSKPLHIVARKDEKPTMNRAQEKALAEIQERQATAAFGMGTVDARPAANYLQIDDVLAKSFRQVG